MKTKFSASKLMKGATFAVFSASVVLAPAGSAAAIVSTKTDHPGVVNPVGVNEPEITGAFVKACWANGEYFTSVRPDKLATVKTLYNRLNKAATDSTIMSLNGNKLAVNHAKILTSATKKGIPANDATFTKLVARSDKSIKAYNDRQAINQEDIYEFFLYGYQVLTTYCDHSSDTIVEIDTNLMNPPMAAYIAERGTLQPLNKIATQDNAKLKGFVNKYKVVKPKTSKH